VERGGDGGMGVVEAVGLLWFRRFGLLRRDCCWHCGVGVRGWGGRFDLRRKGFATRDHVISVSGH